MFGLYFSHLPTLLRTEWKCATFAPVLIWNIWKSKTYLLYHHDRKIIRPHNSYMGLTCGARNRHTNINSKSISHRRTEPCCTGAALDFKLRRPEFNFYQCDSMYPFILPPFYPFLIFLCLQCCLTRIPTVSWIASTTEWLHCKIFQKAKERRHGKEELMQWNQHRPRNMNFEDRYSLVGCHVLLLHSIPWKRNYLTLIWSGRANWITPISNNWENCMNA